MNEQKNFNDSYEKGRKDAMTFAGTVYTGGVVAATLLFLFFVLTAFPNSAYLIRGLMVLAGLLVGASALSFPVTLHNWAVSGLHRTITTVFYYGEICLIVLNTVVSFSTLLFKYAGNEIPGWVAWYEPFTILSLGYVVLAWGTIFINDPQAKAKAKEKAVHDNFIISVAEDMERWTKSIEGKEQIQRAAMQKVIDSFQVKSNEPEHWIKPEEKTQPAPYYPVSLRPSAVDPVANMEDYRRTRERYEPWECESCHAPNGDYHAKFCSKCGAPREVAFSSNGKGKANP